MYRVLLPRLSLSPLVVLCGRVAEMFVAEDEMSVKLVGVPFSMARPRPEPSAGPVDVDVVEFMLKLPSSAKMSVRQSLTVSGYSKQNIEKALSSVKK